MDEPGSRQQQPPTEGDWRQMKPDQSSVHSPGVAASSGLQPVSPQGVIFSSPNEPAHDKTCNKSCVTSKDSDQPIHPPSMARILIYPSLDNPEVAEGSCNQRRL